MLLNIPPFLRISAAKRRKAWADYHPLPPEAPREGDIPPSLTEAGQAAKVERKRKTMQRIQALRSRKAREAMEAEQSRRVWYINGVPMNAIKFARILSELPTESMRALFRSQYSRERPIVVKGSMGRARKSRGSMGKGKAPRKSPMVRRKRASITSS